MKRITLYALLIIRWLLWSGDAPLYAQEPFRILFYNVENLFDCRHDSLKNDTDFLPTGTYRWSPKRFKEKVTKIAKVIIAARGSQLPDLVGLCEVENDYCLTSLTQYSPLQQAGYRYVMTDSPDSRGIDVALLYQRSTFKLLTHRIIRLPHEEIGRGPTRDILHVTGQLLSGDSLDVFVCHFPSRSGGEVQSEPFRLLAARSLRQGVDSVMTHRLYPSVVIMGDFNDYPTNRSLEEVLQAHPLSSTIEPTKLYNLMHGRKGGTYRYKGAWGILDQFIVSGNLLLGTSPQSTTEPTMDSPLDSTLNQRVGADVLPPSLPPNTPRNFTTSFEQVQILTFPFLLQEDDKYGGNSPFRTYHGRKYRGGFSDHLPICIDFSW